ncbi:mitochondrial ribosomal small subunit component [Scheffersomyces spartinae]|uniref:37S ribosomal protein S25, mitochondrial n=1 Tax=Scheffersomyces spartinae TaxID=45513 RepID=A0A9P8AGM6_9ASCO|nr:mitochondrial ribosomal small subunit component [Scheffersomyces spartinae]KAG7191575.1 mitochondrial ribosomal small subunit component [Scheffersomyces spartinae]
MKIQTGATGVYERTSRFIKAGVLRDTPAWYTIVGSHPPFNDMTKKQKLFEAGAQKADPFKQINIKKADGYYKTRHSKNDLKVQHNSIFRVQKLQFIEDQIRDVFYHQHPWEFSRPKILIENNDADTYKKCDWSHMLQLYKPLDGESVVQRTLWLLSNSKPTPMSLEEAYDAARFEFYQLRMSEEMSSTVSREESELLGAVYPTTHMEWGLKQEAEYIDPWTVAAAEMTQIKESGKSSKSKEGSMGSESTVARESIWESAIVEGGESSQ